MRKKNYFYLMSKLKIAPVFSVFYEENNLPLESDFNKATFYNKTFQIVFLKDDKNKNFEHIDKDCIEMQNFL